MKRTFLLAGLVVAWSVSCSERNGNDPEDSDTDEATDASDIGDATDVEVEVEDDGPPTVDVNPAEPAALPVLTPCPEGWREVTDDGTGVVVCDPWPETGPGDCADDEAHLPGEPGCERVGPACPSGDYAEDLPTDRTIVYVLAGASSGGDGSITSPFASLEDATAASMPTDVIAVGRGTYEACIDS